MFSPVLVSFLATLSPPPPFFNTLLINPLREIWDYSSRKSSATQSYNYKVFLCLHYPLNSGMDYRIFNMRM